MKWVFSIALSLCSVFGINQVSAHISGGEIGWKYIGKDSIKVTVSIYRDCNDVRLSATPITITSSCGTKTYPTSMKLIGDITPVCESQCTPCTGGSSCSFNYGDQLYELSAIVALSAWRAKSCCNITIAFQRCCRSGQPITGSRYQNFYVNAQLDICSPDSVDLAWAYTPITITCLGREHFAVTSAITNKSGDSIVYSLTDPKTSATGKTSWSSGYSSQKPLQFLGFPKTSLPFPRGFHYDSLSGEMKFVPRREETTVITTKAEVFRQGTKVAETIRDVILVVIKCPDLNLPIISGVNCSTAPYGDIEVHACVGEKLNLTICTSDKDKRDTVSIWADYDIAGAQDSVVNRNDKKRTLNFLWSPDSSHLRKEPYLVSVFAKDDDCPINSQQSRQVKIYVTKPPVFSIEHIIKDCGKVLLITHNPDTLAGLSRLWEVDGKYYSDSLRGVVDTFEITYGGGGFKQVNAITSTPKKCDITLKDSFTLPADFTSFGHTLDTIGCENSTMQLKAFVYNVQDSFKVKWGTGDSSNLRFSTTSFPMGTNDTVITVSFTDNKCSFSDSIHITPVPTPKVILQDTILACMGDVIQAEALYFSSSPSPIHIWSFNRRPVTSEPLSGRDGSRIKTLEKGHYLHTAVNGYGCAKVDSIYLAHKTITANVSLPDTQFCTNSLAALGSKSYPGGYFNWYYKTPTTHYIAKEVDSINQIFLRPVTLHVEYVDTTYDITCKLTDSLNIDTLMLPKIEIDHVSGFCDGDSVVFKAKPKKGSWLYKDINYPGDELSILPKGRTGNVSYYGTALNGCSSDTSYVFNVFSNPEAKFTLLDTVFINTKVNAIPLATLRPENSYRWTIGDPVFSANSGYTLAWTADSSGIFPVKLEVTNGKTGCFSEFVKDSLTVLRPTGIAGQSWSIQIYPNPARDEIHIYRQTNKTATYSIVNVNGKRMLSGKLLDTYDTIDISALQNGVYLIKVKHGYVQKIYVHR